MAVQFPGPGLRDRVTTPEPILSLGLAKQVGADSGLTHTGQILGTPSYMAPEQATGGANVGIPADIYALGAILYELLTGRPPFRGGSPWETMIHAVHELVVPPTRLRAGIPRDLEVICLKSLAKEPAGRYASADALAEDLRRLREGESILARPAGAARRTWLWCRRRPAVAALVAAVAVVASGPGRGGAIPGTRDGPTRPGRRGRWHVPFADQPGSPAQAERVRPGPGRPPRPGAGLRLPARRPARPAGRRRLAGRPGRRLSETRRPRAGDRPQARGRGRLSPGAGHPRGPHPRAGGEARGAGRRRPAPHEGRRGLPLPRPQRRRPADVGTEPGDPRNPGTRPTRLRPVPLRAGRRPERPGRLSIMLKKPAVSRESLERSLRLREELVSAHPGERDYRGKLSNSYYNPGVLASNTGGPVSDSIEFHRKAEEQRRIRLKSDPGRIEWLADLGRILLAKGGQLFRSEDGEGSIRPSVRLVTCWKG